MGWFDKRIGTGTSEDKVAKAAFAAARKGTLSIQFDEDGIPHMTVGGLISKALDNFALMMGGFSRALEELTSPEVNGKAGACYDKSAKKMAKIADQEENISWF